MFSERLKAARTEAGLSQKALAARLFVSQQAVGKWEVDQGSPNPETIARMAEIFDVSADYLLGRTERKDKSPTSEGERLDPMEEKLMQYMKAMTPDQKQLLLAQMQVMSEQNK